MDCALLEPIQHGTQEKNIAFYNHRFPSDEVTVFGDFSAHWHTEYEIIYVFQGPALFSLNEKVHRVESGQALFVNKNVIHASVSPVSPQIHYVCVTFGEQFLFSNVLDILYKEYFFPLHTGQKQIPAYIPGECEWQKQMLHIMKSLCVSGLKRLRGCELEWRILLLQFFYVAYIYNIFTEKDTRTESHIVAVQAALLTIQKNYADTIHISDLAKASGFSLEYFCRIFKSIVGKTPNEYLLSHRIQQAEYLLSHTSYNISEIALACGFNDINYFSKYFKKVHHLTPSQYRKNFQ